MDAVIQHADTLQGTLATPPDKSIAHRAVLIAALAEGETEIRPWPDADDCQWTLQLIQQLGIVARRSSQSVWVQGGRLRRPQEELPCGESGTTLRLVAGLLAGQPFASRLAAGTSLSQRPMQRVIEPLSQMGAQIEGTVRDPRSPERYPPLTIHGKHPLRAIRYTLPVASAQVKSAVLLAGLFADGQTVIREPQPTRDHTERMLTLFGARVSRQGSEVTVDPSVLRTPGTVILPGDVSSAAFFIVAASCVPAARVTLMNVGLNPTRIAFLDVLKRMGAALAVTLDEEAPEPRGTVVIDYRLLRGLTLEAHEVPGLIDELPILMVAAACATGTTVLRGVGELRVKETDRVRSMMAGLQRLGARVRLTDRQTVEIEGGPLVGAPVESAGDHRTAMSLAVAGLVAQGTTVIGQTECVAKSFPAFFDQLRLLVAASTVKTVDKP